MINNSFLEKPVKDCNDAVALAEKHKEQAVRNFEHTYKLCMVLCALEIITPEDLGKIQFVMNTMVANLP